MEQAQPAAASLKRLYYSRTDGRRNFDARHMSRILSNNQTAQRSRVVFHDPAFQKVIRGGTGVVYRDAHSAPRRDIQ